MERLDVQLSRHLQMKLVIIQINVLNDSYVVDDSMTMKMKMMVCAGRNLNLKEVDIMKGKHWPHIEPIVDDIRFLYYLIFLILDQVQHELLIMLMFYLNIYLIDTP